MLALADEDVDPTIRQKGRERQQALAEAAKRAREEGDGEEPGAKGQRTVYNKGKGDRSYGTSDHWGNDWNRGTSSKGGASSSDRPYGGKGSHSGCFICGGPHFARECEFRDRTRDRPTGAKGKKGDSDDSGRYTYFTGNPWKGGTK